jgi:hypothetical protein
MSLARRRRASRTSAGGGVARRDGLPGFGGGFAGVRGGGVRGRTSDGIRAWATWSGGVGAWGLPGGADVLATGRGWAYGAARTWAAWSIADGRDVVNQHDLDAGGRGWSGAVWWFCVSLA